MLTLLTETSFNWEHTIAAVVATLIIAGAGWLRTWLKSRWPDKYDAIIDMAVDAANEWAQKVMKKSGMQPGPNDKLAIAVKFAQQQLKKAPGRYKDTETVIKAIEGALAFKKDTHKHVVRNVTSIINRMEE